MRYKLKDQRNIYLKTIENDILLYSSKESVKLDQFHVGRKIFGKYWDSIVFRLVINICLPVLSIILNLYYFIKFFFLSLKPAYKGRISRLFVSNDRLLYKRSLYAGLQNKGDCWLKSPFDDYDIPNAEGIVKIGVADLLTCRDVCLTFLQTVLAHILVVKQYGYDKYLLSFNACKWFIVDFSLRHIPYDVEIIYSNLIDRNAILYDNLPHSKKSIIQHGSLYYIHNHYEEKFYEIQTENHKIYVRKNTYKSAPSTVYYLSENDKIAFVESVIRNIPNYIFIGYGFQPTEKPQRKSVLIIGNYTLFSNQEEAVLSQLQNTDMDIYLKNHPTLSDDCYNIFKEKYKFQYIEGRSERFPDVDIVISHESTLAFEYESIGTKVLYYENIDMQRVADEVLYHLKREKQ